jgi:hypothetical protein
VTNPFAPFGIDHLSASSLNLWINAPDVWVAKYLLRAKFQFSAAAERGKSVESAVAAILSGTPEQEAIDAALATFDRWHPFPDEKTTRERDLVAPMTRIAVAELVQFGRPDFPESGQHRVSITAQFGDWSIPVIGYLDLVFPDHGLVIDLKTTTRVPSVMSAEHQLQRAIYAATQGNSAVRFLYVSDKKAAMLEDGDPAEILARAKAQISRLGAFLSRCGDAETARQIVPVTPSSFHWTGAGQLLSEIYGL